MKKTLTIVSLLAGAAISVHAQGQIQWQSDSGGWQIYIYAANYGPAQATQIVGQPAALGGSTVYSSPGLGGDVTGSGSGAAGVYNGNSYSAGLYVASSTAALQTALNSGAPLQTAAFDTISGDGAGWYVGVGDAAQLPIDAILTPSAGAYGATVYVSIAAWYSAGGAQTLAQAAAAGVPEGDDGISAPIALNTAISVPPDLSASGLQSFDLIVPATVPEPSTIALGVMGASALLFRRRK